METMAPAPVVDRLQQSGFSQLCTDLFRANPTPSLLVSGVEGLVVLANPALEQYTGYKADSLIGKAIAELPFCCDCEQGSDLGRLTADPASLDGYQCRLRHCEGHNLPVLISTRRLEHEGVPHLLISFTDITDLKLTEEQLRQSERFYRDLYEGSRDGYALCDLSGRIIECNESFAEILGSTPDDCRGLHYVQITPAKWHAAEERILSEQLAESDSTEVFEKEYIKSDGTRVPVELRAHLRRDINGVPIGLWAFVRDVSQRKQIEKERHVNELKFRTLTEQALMAVIIYDEERVHYVNKTAAELLRVSCEQAMNWSTKELVATIVPEDRPYIEGLLRKLMSGPELGFKEAVFRVKPPDGQVLHLKGISRMVILEGRRHIMFHGFDVTDLYDSMDKLRQANQVLESREQALEEKNVALKQVLQQLDEDKQEMQRSFEANIETTVEPLLRNLEAAVAAADGCEAVNQLRQAIHGLLSPFLGALKKKHPALSRRESEVCHLIREGLSSREIALQCGVAESTVGEWRKRIRRKLGLTSRRVNLTSYLRRIND